MKRVLLEDAWSGNWRKFENAFNTFKSLGSGEVTDELIQILNTHGNVEMALEYLNCGNERLRKAAEEWAKKHGYRVEVRVMTVP